MSTRFNADLLAVMNDEVTSVPYGHGHLVTLPLHFYDDDRIVLFVEEADGGHRISDRGTGALRLHMADVNLDAPRVKEAWDQSLGSLRQHDFWGEDGVIAALSGEKGLGDMLLRVAEASLRIDQLRWMAPEPRRMPFRARVVKRLNGITEYAEVTPNAPIKLRSARTRQVTASVGYEDNVVYVQAVGRGDRDQAIEHCHFLFNMSNIPEQRRIAVADGRETDWPKAMVNELKDVAQVAFYDGDTDRAWQALLETGLESARS